MAKNISMALFPSIVLLIYLLAIIHLAESDQTDTITTMVLSESDGGRPLLSKIDCPGACEERCQLSSRPNLCNRACGTCCARCDCVPPGTSGNYDACPCYANMTTHGGRHKCP